MVALADALEVVEIEEQGEVAFVRLDVMHDRRPISGSPAPQGHATAAMLALVVVPE